MAVRRKVCHVQMVFIYRVRVYVYVCVYAWSNTGHVEWTATDMGTCHARRVCGLGSALLLSSPRGDRVVYQLLYEPGRFALDKSQLSNKWAERSRAGFYVGRLEEFVWMGKRGAAKWWDGHCFRVVMHNYYAYEQKLVDLIAPNDKFLPDFPSDSTPAPASLPLQPPTMSDPTIPTAGDTSAAHDVPAHSTDVPMITAVPTPDEPSRDAPPQRDRKQVVPLDPSAAAPSKSTAVLHDRGPR